MNVSTLRGLSGLLTAAAVVSLPAYSNAQDVAWAYVNPVGKPASFALSSAYSFSTGGGAVTVARDASQNNRFIVRLPNVGGSGGTVLASAYDGNHTAVINGWSTSGSDIRVTVELFNPNATPADDGKFTISFRRGGDDDSRQAYLYANEQLSASYTPTASYSWNGNRPSPTINRLGIGHYQVILPNLASGSSERGHVQVTPYSPVMLRAKVSSWSHGVNDVTATVRVFGALGLPADGKFTLSYNETAAPIAGVDGSGAHVWANEDTLPSYTPDHRYADANGNFGPTDAQKIDRLGVGIYRVRLPSVAPVASATAQVTAYGNNTDYASIDTWSSNGCGGSEVVVNTWNGSGAPTDSKFNLSFLTNRPAVSQAVAWAYVNPPSQGASFTPSMSYQFTTSGEPITVDRDPTQNNRFIVNLNGMSPTSGVPHVCAKDGNHTAVINSWTNSNGNVRVAVETFDASGNPADNEAFNIHFRRGGNNTNREAYLFANQQSNASYTPSTYYSWNADRAHPTIVRTAAGIYHVTLPGLATSSSFEKGNVQVSPYSSAMLRAKVANWYSVGDDLLIEVLTTNASGALVDGRFTLSFNQTAAPIAEHDGSGAHVWADDAVSASYTPDPEYTDSNGTLGPANSETVERLSLGVYQVLLPDLAPSMSSTVQVTAYGYDSHYATVDFWNGTGVAFGTRVRVQTFNAAGNPVDASFTLLYLTNRLATGQIPATTTTFGAGCNGPVLEARNRPVSCTTWDLELSGIPGGAVLGFVQLGFSNPSVVLGASAPGCTQYTSGAASQIVLLPVPDPVFSMDIPASAAFIGLPIYAQGGALVPGLNTFGLAASNGVLGVIGDI